MEIFKVLKWLFSRPYVPVPEQVQEPVRLTYCFDSVEVASEFSEEVNKLVTCTTVDIASRVEVSTTTPANILAVDGLYNDKYSCVSN